MTAIHEEIVVEMVPKFKKVFKVFLVIQCPASESNGDDLSRPIEGGATLRSKLTSPIHVFKVPKVLRKERFSFPEKTGKRGNMQPITYGGIT